jgi:hypothetical protein
MKLKDKLAKAIRENDGQTAGRIVDFLRFQHGMNYRDCYELAAKVWRDIDGGELTEAEWENLMYAADMGD